MWTKFKRLFVIKTRFEAYLIIYGLALGAMTRGAHYTQEYPGIGGYLLFAANGSARGRGSCRRQRIIRYI